MELKRFGRKENTAEDAASKEKRQKTDRRTAILKAFGRGKEDGNGAVNEIVFGDAAPEVSPAVPVFSAGSDGFTAGVRSAEPMISLDAAEEGPSWKKGLVLNISGAVLLMAFLSMFCMVTYSVALIPWLAPGALVFLGMGILESVKPGRPKWIAAGAIAALLAVSVVALRGAVAGGIADLINQFYDAAEAAQAYLYKRIPGGGGDPRMGAAWISCLTGLLASLPPAKYRREALALVTLIAMFAFAYYGLLPSAICAAVLLAALLIAVPRGNIVSSLPLLLAVMLVFGAVVLIDPGENAAVSRLDENYRDRFALNSRLIQDIEEQIEIPDEISDPSAADTPQDDTVLGTLPKKYLGLAAAVLIIAALVAAAYMAWRRIDKKRKALREGIDSHDPKTAVTAMFPYTVRWLKAGGIDTDAHPFSELTPYIAGEYSQDYANRYRKMYLLWREAAYSDHRIGEQEKKGMEEFLRDTTEMIREKLTFTDRLRVMLKYSL